MHEQTERNTKRKSSRTHVEEGETDDEEVLDRLGSAHGDELTRSAGGSTGGDEVVDHEDGRTLGDRVLLKLEGVLSVLERLRREATRGSGRSSAQ